MPPGYVVELADHFTLQLTPETLDRIRMNVTIGVALLVIEFQVIDNLLHSRVTPVFISNQSGILRIDMPADKGS